jgi:hypothetical protein
MFHAWWYTQVQNLISSTTENNLPSLSIYIKKRIISCDKTISPQFFDEKGYFPN